MITVIKPGESVLIGLPKSPILAGVNKVALGMNGTVEYQVVWWNGATRMIEWLPDIEVAPAPHSSVLSQNIGFHNGQNRPAQ